jgi:hypothetical protein
LDQVEFNWWDRDMDDLSSNDLQLSESVSLSISSTVLVDLEMNKDENQQHHPN